jgi:hypothetical protein
VGRDDGGLGLIDGVKTAAARARVAAGEEGGRETSA